MKQSQINRVRRFLNYIQRNSTFLMVTLIIVIAIIKFLLCFYLQDSALNRGNSHTPLLTLAKNVCEHNTYSLSYPVISIDYEPLYSILIGLSFKIFGINWIGLAVLHIFITSVGAWFFYKLSTNLTNELIGFFSTAFYLFYPYYFLYSLSVFDTNLFLPLLLAFLYYLVNHKENKMNYGIAGVLLGGVFLTRGSVIALLPAFFLYIFYKEIIQFKNIKKFLAASLTLCFFTLLSLGPWLIRNYSATEQIIISSHGSFGVWQGNNEHSLYYLKNDISLDTIYKLEPPPEIIKKYPTKGKNPNEAIVVANAFKEASIDFIKNNPGEFIHLAFVKFIKFWSPIRNPKSTSLAYSSNNTRQYIYFISYFPLLILFPFGLYFLFKTRRDVFILFAAMLLFYTGAHMIAMGFTRARIPIDFILILSTGYLFFEKGFFFRKKSKI
jgi:4-amino-4-deoxy-L-arabinose transferase-like glycosyltransferase